MVGESSCSVRVCACGWFAIALRASKKMLGTCLSFVGRPCRSHSELSNAYWMQMKIGKPTSKRIVICSYDEASNEIDSDKNQSLQTETDKI